MHECSHIAIRLLPHVNMLMMMYGGAGLATAARFKWDPSTYIALREVFPREYRVAIVTLTATSLTLVVLAHLALFATSAASIQYRRPLLLLYAVMMVLLACVELVWSTWTLLRLRSWLRSEQGQRLLQALDIKDYYVRPLMGILGKWFNMPRRAKELLDEADSDTPRNLYVAMGATTLLAVLQSLAVTLALIIARSSRARTSSHELSIASASQCRYRKVPLTTIL